MGKIIMIILLVLVVVFIFASFGKPNSKYDIEDLSQGKYSVSNMEYEKLYDRACSAAFAWIDVYSGYKGIEDSRLTIFSDGSVMMQIEAVEGDTVAVGYSDKDGNGDRVRGDIIYDSAEEGA